MDEDEKYLAKMEAGLYTLQVSYCFFSGILHSSISSMTRVPAAGFAQSYMYSPKCGSLFFLLVTQLCYLQLSCIHSIFNYLALTI